MSFLIYPREAITNNGGKGGDNRGNRRRPFRRRGNNGPDNNSGKWQDIRKEGTEKNRNPIDTKSADQKSLDPKPAEQKPSSQKPAVQKQAVERPKWVPPHIQNANFPAPDCPYCGKPIKDIVSALTDKGTGKAAHFDCIIAKISEREVLEKGDFVSYIGGGRFGIVRFNNPADTRKFTIKKILEWENKDDRPEWRSAISDHYSVT